MDKFLSKEDELGTLIQHKAAELYFRLQHVDVDQLGMPPHCLHYFKTSHSKRLFFSIETSANLLYRSITLIKKEPRDIVLMDYGAGVGTLFLLAKMIGCRKVVYNDHLEDWKKSALLIGEAIGVHIDHYIVSDIHECLKQLDALELRCDIITSRNVIEHIYKLDEFYKAVHDKQPQAVIFSSTTANKQNPASVIKHRLWHRKWERVFRGKRMMIIDRQAPGLSETKKRKLAKGTRGLAAGDLEAAIEEYRKSGFVPNPSVYGSNTCDPANGVWAEHLLDENEYRLLINEKQYTIIFSPGFWDTHYAGSLKNSFASLMNRLIAQDGKTAMKLAPFIYVIAIPEHGKHPTSR